MKRLVSLLMVGVVLLMSSCGGGWDEEKKTKVKNQCIAKAEYDCDCYMEKTLEHFKTPEDFNNQKDDVKKAFEKSIKDCEKEEEVNDENLESF